MSEEKDLIPDQRVVDRLEDLRNFVDTFNQVPKLANRGDTFKELNPGAIYTADLDGFVFGYRLVDLGLKLKREVFIKAPGEILSEIPAEQLQPIILAVYKVFVENGQGPVQVHDYHDSGLKKDTMMFTQEVMPMVLIERNPNLIVPGSRKH